MVSLAGSTGVHLQCMAQKSAFGPQGGKQQLVSSVSTKYLNSRQLGLLGSSMLLCFTLFIVKNTENLDFPPQCISLSVLKSFNRGKLNFHNKFLSQIFCQVYFLAGVPLVSKTRKITASEFCMRFIKTKKLIQH